RFIVGLAHRAVIVVVDRAQAAEAADDAGAQGAEQQPIHGEQADRGGVEERSIVSASAMPRSIANLIGLTRKTAWSSPVRTSVSRRDVVRGLQGRAASSAAKCSSSARSSILASIPRSPLRGNFPYARLTLSMLATAAASYAARARRRGHI